MPCPMGVKFPPDVRPMTPAERVDLQREQASAAARFEKRDAAGDFMDALFGAYGVAVDASQFARNTEEDRSEAAAARLVLGVLISSIMGCRPAALETMVRAARAAKKQIPGRPRERSIPDFRANIKKGISRTGQPPGAPVERVARRLAWLLEEYDWESAMMMPSAEALAEDRGCSIEEEELWFKIRAAIPARFVVAERVFVSPNVAHKAGASPRNKRPLCRCADCAAAQIMRAAERATGLRFPKTKTRRSK